MKVNLIGSQYGGSHRAGEENGNQDLRRKNSNQQQNDSDILENISDQTDSTVRLIQPDKNDESAEDDQSAADN